MQINRDKYNFFPPAEFEDECWNELIKMGSCRTVNAGMGIYLQGMELDKLCFIISGEVKIIHVFASGNEKLYGRLYAPSVIGLCSLWNDGGKTYYPTAVAVKNTVISEVPLACAEKYFSDKPELLIALFKCIRNLMWIERIKAVGSAQLTMLQKAAFALVFLFGSDKDEEGFVSLTHEELAQLIGISRANATTALAELEERKLILKKRGKIKIADMDSLMKLVNNQP